MDYPGDPENDRSRRAREREGEGGGREKGGENREKRLKNIVHSIMLVSGTPATNLFKHLLAIVFCKL